MRASIPDNVMPPFDANHLVTEGARRPRDDSAMKRWTRTLEPRGSSAQQGGRCGPLTGTEVLGFGRRIKI